MRSLKDWSRALAEASVILGGGFWAFYTFLWKEIWVPERAPATLVLDVSMTPTGRRRSTPPTDAQAVEMQVTVNATNSGQKTLYLLPGFWQIVGTDVQPDPRINSFSEAAKFALEPGSLDHAERYNLLRISAPVATGALFADDTIHPGEKLSRNVILRIPRIFRSATIELYLPALVREPSEGLFSGKTLVWSYQVSGDAEGVLPSFCPAAGQPDSCSLSQSGQLNRLMKAFDPRSVLFFRSRQVAL